MKNGEKKGILGDVTDEECRVVEDRVIERNIVYF